jgi:hypothetical protein
MVLLQFGREIESWPRVRCRADGVGGRAGKRIGFPRRGATSDPKERFWWRKLSGLDAARLPGTPLGAMSSVSYAGILLFLVGGCKTPVLECCLLVGCASLHPPCTEASAKHWDDPSKQSHRPSGTSLMNDSYTPTCELHTPLFDAGYESGRCPTPKRMDQVLRARNDATTAGQDSRGPPINACESKPPEFRKCLLYKDSDAAKPGARKGDG